ncbi:unannotated protein [freshwater metagenome]|uniref:Unannotated protein n=1 Tax=freshwater metagenome TaxID=449393 RepID=A0A6J7QG59_9ZZZZ
MTGAGKQPVEIDDPCDAFVGRARRRREEPLSHALDEPVGRERQSIVTEAGSGRYERERRHALGRIEREHLRDCAAHRVADHVSPGDTEHVEHAERVGRERVESVRRVWVDLGAGPAVARVEGHHPVAGVAERVDQRGRPTQRGRVAARKQKDRYLVQAGAGGRVVLDPQLEAVDVDQHGRFRSIQAGWRGVPDGEPGTATVASARSTWHEVPSGNDTRIGAFASTVA